MPKTIHWCTGGVGEGERQSVQTLKRSWLLPLPQRSHILNSEKQKNISAMVNSIVIEMFSSCKGPDRTRLVFAFISDTWDGMCPTIKDMCYA